MGDEKEVRQITFGILTVSDRCSDNVAFDESGHNLAKMIGNGVVENGKVVTTALVPDDKVLIEEKLKEWCDVDGVEVILTTGGTGIARRDVTPEATLSLLCKEIPGIPNLMFKRSSEVTPLAALSRATSGVRGGTLIVNLPGSKKASQECLEAVAGVIPHAVDLIRGNTGKVEETHSELQKSQRKSKVSSRNVAERPRVSTYEAVEVSEALEIVLQRLFLMRAQKIIDFEDALGFVLAEDVVTVDFLPPVDVSLKDGYAISNNSSEPYTVIGHSCAGTLEIPELEGKKNCCVRINTGAAVPKGAFAVVEVEYTKVCTRTADGTEEKEIIVSISPSKLMNIRFRGSDFKKGEMVLTRGTRLDPAAVGLLAAVGASSVSVFAKPVVGVLSTGDELVNPRDNPPPGKVRDSNRVTLLSILKEENFIGLDLGIVADDPDALFRALEKGFRAADIVVTSGGVSMGDRDFLKEVMVTDFDAEICFGSVRMKPGKPTSFAHLVFEGKPKLWFGLPGNPASASVTAQMFLLPALRKISGHDQVLPLTIYVPLKETVFGDNRPHYVRAFVSWDKNKKSFEATTTGDQSSSAIASCVNANAYLQVNAGDRNYPLRSQSYPLVQAWVFGKLLNSSDSKRE